MQRKAKQRKELDLDRYETASEASDVSDLASDGDKGREQAKKRHYHDGNAVTTVTTASLALHRYAMQACL